MEARPLYLDCNRSQALTAWCGEPPRFGDVRSVGLRERERHDDVAARLANCSYCSACLDGEGRHDVALRLGLLVGPRENTPAGMLQPNRRTDAGTADDLRA